MIYKNLRYIVLLILIAFFCIFAITWEYKERDKHQNAIEQIAVVLAPALWNLDLNEQIEFLKMVHKLDNYRSLSVYTLENKPLVEIPGKKLSLLDSVFVKLGLIQKNTIKANIYHNKAKIGSVIAVHHHNTIYANIYMVLTLCLIALIIQYLFLTIETKKRLEDRVKERTKELYQSENQYRSTVDGLLVGVIVHDTEARILICNQEAVRILGLPTEQIVDKNIIDDPSWTFIDENLKTLKFEEYPVNKVISSKKPITNFELGIKHNDSKDITWVTMNARPLFFDNGELEKVIVNFLDITNKRLATQGLQRYKQIIEATNDHMGFIDCEYKCLAINTVCLKSWKKTYSQVIGKPIPELMGKDAFENHMKINLDKCLAGEEIHSQAWVLFHGIKQYMDTFYYPYRNSKGRITGAVISSHNSTKQQQMLEELQNTKIELKNEHEKLMVTLHSIGDGVITTNVDGKVVMLNKIAEDLTGWKNVDAINQPLNKIFHIINEATKEICENPVSKVMASGGIVGLANHTALISKDGTRRAIADSGAPIRNLDGDIIGVVLVFRDVTEQQKMELEANKARKLESVGVLAGGIAHDFNNILAAILGNINLAKNYSKPEQAIYPLLVQAEKASLRAKNLTQQLLTFSKGGEPVIRIASIIDIIEDSSSFVLRGSKVRCDTSFATDIWPVSIDPGQISQVIQNLIINASHAMPKGGIIEINCENTTIEKDLNYDNIKYVTVTIKDQGVGIAPDIIENIFDPYFTTKSTGSGLGLAICHSIIKQHNGIISVESELGKGTCFMILLPASNDKITDLSTEKTDPIKPGHGKIMIMDDDEMIRNISQAMLNNIGYETQLATNGAEAIKMYKQDFASNSQADLIIMDLTIPGGMGGKDAIKKILEINKETKVIVSSGYSNDPIIANFADYGFCGVIVKPYLFEELASIVQQFVNC